MVEVQFPRVPQAVRGKFEQGRAARRAEKGTLPKGIFAREGLPGARQNMSWTVTDGRSAIMAMEFLRIYAAGKCVLIGTDFPAILLKKKEKNYE